MVELYGIRYAQTKTFFDNSAKVRDRFGIERSGVCFVISLELGSEGVTYAWVSNQMEDDCGEHYGCGVCASECDGLTLRSCLRWANSGCQKA
jgi:hypothetical protein